MMFDDIANNPSNPFKGNIINKPNGTNVYAGVNKDYTGNDVTAINFLNVLNGSASAMSGIGSGKVINSGPDDNIFVYYSDHGAPGLVAMPSGPYLYATDLLSTLQGMHTQKRYKKLVFYLESCESGSMFTALPTDISVYATTAATPDQSSYAFYFDSTRNTYLGDEYSIRWMEDSDAEDESKWSLLQQFQLLQKEVKESQPQTYGDQTYNAEAIQDFQSFDKFTASGMQTSKQEFVAASNVMQAADSRDVALFTLTNMLSLAKTFQDSIELNAQLLAEVENRVTVDTRFVKLIKIVEPSSAMADRILSAKLPVTKYDCLRRYIENYEAQCERLSDYALKYVRVFANMCELGYSADKVFAGMMQMC